MDRHSQRFALRDHSAVSAGLLFVSWAPALPVLWVSPVQRSSMSRFANQALVAECLALIAPAEAAFSSRWRLSSLLRVDGELHARLLAQIDDYSQALIAGSPEELKIQAAAMVRGWAACCLRMEREPDDAYLVGLDHQTGTQIVVSGHKQSIEHVAPRAGYKLLSVSPDEIAKLLGGMEAVAAAKAAFPDAEIVGVDAPQGPTNPQNISIASN